MEQRLVYRDSDGVRRTLIADKEEGNLAVFTEFDAEQFIKTNRALAETHVQGSDNKLVARVPITVVEKAMVEGWFDDEEAWRKFLNDPENRDFRIWPGRL